LSDPLRDHIRTHKKQSVGNFTIPLKEQEWELIKMGGFVKYHFHPETSEVGIVALVGREGMLPKKDSVYANNLLMEGWDIVPLVLKEHDIEMVESGEKVPTAQYSGGLSFSVIRRKNMPEDIRRKVNEHDAGGHQ